MCPVESKINFVVPSDKILRDFKPVIQIPIKLEPDIFYMMISLLLNCQIQHRYLQQVVRNLHLDYLIGGDVDCLGFEPEPVKVRCETFDKKKDILLNVVHELKQNKGNILVHINKHMFEKWMQSVTDIVIITCKEICSLWDNILLCVFFI